MVEPDCFEMESQVKGKCCTGMHRFWRSGPVAGNNREVITGQDRKGDAEQFCKEADCSGKIPL